MKEWGTPYTKKNFPYALSVFSEIFSRTGWLAFILLDLKPYGREELRQHQSACDTPTPGRLDRDHHPVERLSQALHLPLLNKSQSPGPLKSSARQQALILSQMEVRKWLSFSMLRKSLIS